MTSVSLRERNGGRGSPDRRAALEVVDLAVEDDVHGAVFVRHRLAGGIPEVDNLEPAMQQRGGSTTVQGSFVGVAKTAFVTVSAPAASVTLNSNGLFLLISQTYQLSATVKDAAGNVINRSVIWSSSNPGAATVSGSGLVTAVGDGNAYVSATVDGVSATATFAVAGCRDCSGGGYVPVGPIQ